MKAMWKAEFPGHYMGGVAVFMGPDTLIAAKDIVMKRLAENGLGDIKRRDVKMKEIHCSRLEPGEFIYFDNGDY